MNYLNPGAYSAISLLGAISQGEGACVVQKQLSKKVIETLAAFANTQDGKAITVFKVPGGVNVLLAYIGVNLAKRASALAEVLDTPLRLIERWLKRLKAQGLIEITGAPTTGGYCVVEIDSFSC